MHRILNNHCDNTPPVDPYYLNQPNYFWPSESSNGFSHLRPGVFHISLPTYKIHNRGGGRKEKTKTKNNRARVSTKRKREEICNTFVQLSVHLQVIAGVYLRETSTKPLGMLTRLLALVNPASVGSTGPSSRLSDFC